MSGPRRAPQSAAARRGRTPRRARRRARPWSGWTERACSLLEVGPHAELLPEHVRAWLGGRPVDAGRPFLCVSGTARTGGAVSAAGAGALANARAARPPPPVGAGLAVFLSLPKPPWARGPPPPHR